MIWNISMQSTPWTQSSHFPEKQRKTSSCLSKILWSRDKELVSLTRLSRYSSYHLTNSRRLKTLLRSYCLETTTLSPQCRNCSETKDSISKAQMNRGPPTTTTNRGHPLPTSTAPTLAHTHRMHICSAREVLLGKSVFFDALWFAGNTVTPDSLLTRKTAWSIFWLHVHFYLPGNKLPKLMFLHSYFAKE